MEGRETEARQDAMPKWLGDLVAKWHEDRSCVITFNYDTLVEAAYTQVVKVRHPSHDIPTYETSSQIYRGAFTPAGMRYAAVLAAPTVDTFSLLKLHGSWTWLYSGRPSFFGETIYDRPVLPGWELKPFASEPWLTEKKVPLIVPPTAGKVASSTTRPYGINGGLRIKICEQRTEYSWLDILSHRQTSWSDSCCSRPSAEVTKSGAGRSASTAAGSSCSLSPRGAVRVR